MSGARFASRYFAVSIYCVLICYDRSVRVCSCIGHVLKSTNYSVCVRCRVSGRMRGVGFRVSTWGVESVIARKCPLNVAS